jgi:DNA (cytosine-5)-methyltransferase 1
MSACRPGLAATYPDLVGATRAALVALGRPWVIENVPGAGLRPDLVLCVHMVGLPLYRHRVFESSEFMWQPDHARHAVPGGRAGHWKPGQIISVSGTCSPIALARRAMGIDWMNRRELAESIPPAYTEYLGGLLFDVVRSGVDGAQALGGVTVRIGERLPDGPQQSGVVVQSGALGVDPCDEPALLHG